MATAVTIPFDVVKVIMVDFCHLSHKVHLDSTPNTSCVTQGGENVQGDHRCYAIDLA